MRPPSGLDVDEGSMPTRSSLPVVVLSLGAALAVAGAQSGPATDAAVQYQLASLLFEETRYAEALEAFRRAAESEDSSVRVPARIGLVKSALRIGELQSAVALCNSPIRPINFSGAVSAVTAISTSTLETSTSVRRKPIYGMCNRRNPQHLVQRETIFLLS